jgi:hypothetical protein
VTVPDPAVNGSLVHDPPWISATPGIGSRVRRRPGVLWAFVPVMTLGVGSGPAFAYVSLRYHKPRFLLPASAYALATAGAVILISLAHPLTIGFGVALLLMCMGMASAHALAIRRDVAIEIDDNDLHVTAARERLRRREQARKLATGDPKLAHELGIGRPDLHGQFDDGGLVDVNHSPVEVLAALSGIDRQTAQRIVSTRAELGGFTSLEELSVTLDLHPAQLDSIADCLLFLRS